MSDQVRIKRQASACYHTDLGVERGATGSSERREASRLKLTVAGRACRQSLQTYRRAAVLTKTDVRMVNMPAGGKQSESLEKQSAEEPLSACIELVPASEHPTQIK